METFGKICFGIIAIIASTLLGGFIFMLLWGWFVVPTFNLQYLTLIQCIGLRFFLNQFSGKDYKKDTTFAELGEMFARELLGGGLVLLLGWIIHLFY